MSAQQVINDSHDDRPSAPGRSAFTPEEIGAMIAAARERLVRVAGRHSRFDGLSPDDVEELFDATSEVVLRRHETFVSDDHVRASLWHGMDLRARDVFRRRRRRGLELDPEILDDIGVDLADDEDRIAHEQTLLLVQDFLAALAPREAEVWKLVHGEDLSVLATSKRLGISRHAVGEHLEAATRKLTTFAALADAGQWCGRRQADIDRMLGGVDEEGTVRRALAHLDACADCRRANARRVREAGRIAAGVLPLPALLVETGGRGLLDRLLDLLPQVGGGSGRTEAMAGALLGGGGLTGFVKAGAVVATTATVAVGAGGAALDRESSREERPARERTSAGTPSAAPSVTPPSGFARAASAPVIRPRPRQRTASKASRGQTAAAPRSREPKRSETAEVAELGTVEQVPVTSASAAGPAAPAPAPAPSPSSPSSGGDSGSTEAFLP